MTTPKRFCGRCGSENTDPKDAFCRKCGAALDTIEIVEPAPEPPTQRPVQAPAPPRSAPSRESTSAGIDSPARTPRLTSTTGHPSRNTGGAPSLPAHGQTSFNLLLFRGALNRSGFFTWFLLWLGVYAVGAYLFFIARDDYQRGAYSGASDLLVIIWLMVAGLALLIALSATGARFRDAGRNPYLVLLYFVPIVFLWVLWVAFTAPSARITMGDSTSRPAEPPQVDSGPIPTEEEAGDQQIQQIREQADKVLSRFEPKTPPAAPGQRQQCPRCGNPYVLATAASCAQCGAPMPGLPIAPIASIGKPQLRPSQKKAIEQAIEPEQCPQCHNPFVKPTAANCPECGAPMPKHMMRLVEWMVDWEVESGFDLDPSSLSKFEMDFNVSVGAWLDLLKKEYRRATFDSTSEGTLRRREQRMAYWRRIARTKKNTDQ